MGRVRTNLVKRAARQIIEKYFSRLTLDFDTNKRVVGEVAIIPSKKVRNKIAGFITHLMRRIEKGPVRGISLKLQEEERERRMDFAPERSVLDLDVVSVDRDTADLLNSMNFGDAQRIKIDDRALFRARRPNNQNFRGPRPAGGKKPAAAAPAVAAAPAETSTAAQ